MDGECIYLEEEWIEWARPRKRHYHATLAAEFHIGSGMHRQTSAYATIVFKTDWTLTTAKVNRVSRAPLLILPVVVSFERRIEGAVVYLLVVLRSQLLNGGRT